MPLSSAAIDSVFRRLLARYGAAWEAKWKGVPQEDVRADWARVLDGFDRAALLYGLEYLPDFVPTSHQFREVCRRAPETKPEALPAPKADARLVEAELAKLRSVRSKPRVSPSRQWVYDLEERERNGERLTVFQRDCIRNARANLGIDREAEAEVAENARKVAQYLATQQGTT